MKTLYFPLNNTMAVTFLKKSTIPQTRGIAPSGPAVTVRENGAIGFNKAVMSALGNGERKLAVLGFDEGTRQVLIQAVKAPPKGYTAEDCFHVTFTEKLGIGSIALSGFLKSDGSIDGMPKVNYDYKAVGNQTFEATIDEKKSVVTFTLPESATLTRKPKVARANKANAAAAAAVAAGATATPVAAANVGGADDGSELLSLD